MPSNSLARSRKRSLGRPQWGLPGPPGQGDALGGIDNLEEANRYLQQTLLRELNHRFVVPAASSADMHRLAPRDLNELLSWEEERVVRKDWTVGWEGRCFQIAREHAGLS